MLLYNFMNNKIIEEFIGWYGAIAIISAYALLSFGVKNSDSTIYQMLNATGALVIVFHSFKKRDYQPGVLNIIWTVIAVVSLIKI